MKKKSNIWYSFLILTVFLSIIFNSCSEDATVTPVVQSAVIATSTVSNITQTTASCGGNITSDGGGSITARGVCWSKSTDPTISDSKTTDGTGKGTFTSSITGLTTGTTYYVRAYATNSKGTSYGTSKSFSTKNGTIGKISDIDGNSYNTVIIGTQTWLVENLKVTHYNNNDPIPTVTDNTAWGNLTTGAYCDYNLSSSNGTKYGHLYNGYVVMDSRKVCPTGWHIPTIAEWTTLETYLGGASAAGGKMKEDSYDYWWPPNSGASNSSGFTGLPGGTRYSTGTFNDLTSSGYFWGFEGGGSTQLSNRNLYFFSSILNKNDNANDNSGYSIRCIKD
jgi:uncharacterized protein (TIGR02145 family)